MRYQYIVVGILLIVLSSTLPKSADAGPYADDMAKCLVKSASSEDRTVLVKWIFSVIALHPDLAPMTTISAAQRAGITKDAGALFQRLLVESCRSETQQAIQNEGTQTIAYAFQVLGQVATRGLFTDPHVAEGMQSLAKTIDEGKIKALLEPSAPK